MIYLLTNWCAHCKWFSWYCQYFSNPRSWQFWTNYEPRFLSFLQFSEEFARIYHTFPFLFISFIYKLLLLRARLIVLLAVSHALFPRFEYVSQTSILRYFISLAVTRPAVSSYKGKKYPPAKLGVFIMPAKAYVTSRASCCVGTIYIGHPTRIGISPAFFLII